MFTYKYIGMFNITLKRWSLGYAFPTTTVVFTTYSAAATMK